MRVFYFIFLCPIPLLGSLMFNGESGFWSKLDLAGTFREEGDGVKKQEFSCKISF